MANPLIYFQYIESSWEICEYSTGDGLFISNLRTCVGDYEIKPPIYKTFIEENKCILKQPPVTWFGFTQRALSNT